MDIRVLIEGLAIGALFGGLLAGAYWGFRRRDPRAWSHAWKIFVCLAIFAAARHYLANAPA